MQQWVMRRIITGCYLIDLEVHIIAGYAGEKAINTGSQHSNNSPSDKQNARPVRSAMGFVKRFRARYAYMAV